MTYRTSRLTDVAVILLMLAIGAAVLIPMAHSNRVEARKYKDQEQVASVMKAMIVWASNSMASYPIPSQIEQGMGPTTPELAESKNTSSNIFSMLVFLSGVSPESLVSPSETSGDVRVVRNYAFQSPPTAVKPNEALWDPAFRATPLEPLRLAGGATDSTRTAPANLSYAHIPPFGKRRCQWADTYNSLEAVFGNRGPTYTSTDTAPQPTSGEWAPVEGPLGMGSLASKVHGEQGRWRGFVGYNDQHVEFEETATPSRLKYRQPHGPQSTEVRDNLFVDESDELSYGNRVPAPPEGRMNAYLRLIYNVVKDGQYSVWRD